MKDRTMLLIGIALIFFGLFLNNIKMPENPVTPDDGLEKPSQEIIDMVDRLAPISNKNDAAKLSGVFNAMSEKLEETDLNNNLSVQYFLDFVGKKSIGDEMMNDDGSKKYPDFAPSAAQLIAEVIGPQDQEGELTEDKKKKLGELFYGFSWKLYDNSEKNTFEEYKNKALSAISEYNNDDGPDTPDNDEECPCGGKGYIIHGDGHKTPCPCIESGQECPHNPKCNPDGYRDQT